MQENTNINTSYTVNESNSLKDLILNIRDWIRYFLSKKYIIILFGLLGGGLGFTYAWLKKPVYTATTSFVLETGGNKGALASYAGIASAFGIDVGSGGGLFEGENILELYRSRNMISRALLSEASFNGKKQLLIDRYIDFKKYKNKWRKIERLKNIRFVASNVYDNDEQQLLHDSIISVIVKKINKENLYVDKIDKKLNIIEAKIQSEDELFSKVFNEVLVKNVNQFYLETKTKKQLQTILVLQEKTDSVRRLLIGSINKAASVADATPNQNLTRLSQKVVPMQSAAANVEISKEILGSLLQNLELNKIALQNEKPLIQLVDTPILPLEKKRPGKLICLILGVFLAEFIAICFLILKKMYNNAIGVNG